MKWGCENQIISRVLFTSPPIIPPLPTSITSLFQPRTVFSLFTVKSKYCWSNSGIDIDYTLVVYLKILIQSDVWDLVKTQLNRIP
jgi:hypothetical protein